MSDGIDRDALMQVLRRAGFDSWTAAGVARSVLDLVPPAPGGVYLAPEEAALALEALQAAAETWDGNGQHGEADKRWTLATRLEEATR